MLQSFKNCDIKRCIAQLVTVEELLLFFKLQEVIEDQFQPVLAFKNRGIKQVFSCLFTSIYGVLQMYL